MSLSLLRFLPWPFPPPPRRATPGSAPAPGSCAGRCGEPGRPSASSGPGRSRPRWAAGKRRELFLTRALSGVPGELLGGDGIGTYGGSGRHRCSRQDENGLGRLVPAPAAQRRRGSGAVPARGCSPPARAGGRGRRSPTAAPGGGSPELPPFAPAFPTTERKQGGGNKSRLTSPKGLESRWETRW